MSVDLGSVAQTLLKGTKRTETSSNPAPITPAPEPVPQKRGRKPKAPPKPKATPKAKAAPKKKAVPKEIKKRTPPSSSSTSMKRQKTKMKDIHPPPPDHSTNRVSFASSQYTPPKIQVESPDMIVDEPISETKTSTKPSSKRVDLDGLFDFNSLTMITSSEQVSETTREVPNDVLPNMISPFVADVEELSAMSKLQPSTTNIATEEGESKDEEIGKLMKMNSTDRRVLFHRSIQAPQPNYPIESFTNKPSLSTPSFIRRATEGISQTLPVNGLVYS